MKSINVKRIAAVAAGVAMVGSVMASGLAVQESGEVSSLVSNIKANLDNTQVVVGTHGADISDGIQAAKIAAVLASVNYAAVSSGTVTLSGKSVVLETGAGVTEPITTSSYPVELTVNSTITTHYTTNPDQDKTLTKDTLSSILAQKSISATVNSSTSTYNYDDQIILTDVDAAYTESTNANYPGHGLYLAAAVNNIEYRIQFGSGTQGLPVGVGRTYTAIPEIDLLGNAVGIDYLRTVNQSLYLHGGVKTTMTAGDEVSTLDGYKVKLDQVMLSGTSHYAIYTATSPTGTTETSVSLGSGQTHNFFAEAVSVYVESVGAAVGGGGTAVTRVTSGTKKLQDNAKFPFDESWTVKHVEVGGTTASAGYLNYIALRYGGQAAQNFGGNVQTGLAQGTVINGPKTASGDPKFQLQLKGFGSTSSIIDTTSVKVEGIGSSGTGITSTHLLKPTWTARDGSTQTLGATMPSQIAIAGPIGGSTSQVSFDNTAKWTIVNDKVVYLEEVTSTSTSPTQYYVKLRVGGLDGTLVTVGPFTNNTGATATFAYTSAVNPIECTLDLGSETVTAGSFSNVTITAGTAISTTDSSAASLCDIVPDVVPIGAATQINTGVPWMDLRFIQGNVSGSQQPVKTNVSGSTTYWPVMVLASPSSAENVTVTFDSDSGDTSALTGLKAYLNLNPYQTATGNPLNNTGNYTSFMWETQQGLVDQAVVGTSFLENNKYDVTPYSVELDATSKDVLSTIMPETRRNAILEVSKTIGNATGGTGTYTATEGQTVGNVKVKTIVGTCTASGSNLYEATNTVIPETLVATDTTASAGYMIVVGGPWVNSVAQGFTGSDLVTNAAGDSYLIAEGQKLLVAGYTAADTAAAADELITKLKA